MPTEPIKPRCRVCDEPGRLRKDGTMREHPAASGTRPCGGTGRDPVIPQPVAEPAGPERREVAVLDGLLRGTEADRAR